jgi:histidyl-tRNA synthetase
VRNVRGMQDVYGNDLKKFNIVVNQAREIAKIGGFFEASTPILEFLEVFERNLGSETDILKKEIYKFEDRGGESLALRPEFTASVVRSFLQNKFKLPAKIFSFGALFRYDRPQKGRLRQFNQINFENLGSGGMLEDAQTIILAYNLLKNLGLLGKFTLEINSLGSKETLTKYKILLTEYFNQNQNSLSSISIERLKNNPIRILDSKEPEDVEIVKNAPKISSVYTEEEKSRFNLLLMLLNKNNIEFIVNEGIVRGLDYYTGVVFEFTTSLLGSQSTILGGGRYDSLVEQMGGVSTPAIGFAGGIERISALLDYKEREENCLFLIPLKEEHYNFCLNLLIRLQQKGLTVQILEGGNAGKRLEKASKSNFNAFAVVIGDSEVSSGKFKIKNLSKSEEVEGDIDFLTSCLQLA